MEKYQNDFVLNQKAKTLYIIFFSLVVVIALMQLSFLIRDIDDPMISGPLMAMVIAVLGLIWLTKRGYYALAANMALCCALAVLWSVMFFANLIHPVEKTDSIILIIATLSLTPLIVTRYHMGIFRFFQFYFPT